MMTMNISNEVVNCKRSTYPSRGGSDEPPLNCSNLGGNGRAGLKVREAGVEENESLSYFLGVVVLRESSALKISSKKSPPSCLLRGLSPPNTGLSLRLDHELRSGGVSSPPLIGIESTVSPTLRHISVIEHLGGPPNTSLKSTCESLKGSLVE